MHSLHMERLLPQAHLQPHVSSAVSPSTCPRCLQLLLFLKYVWAGGTGDSSGGLMFWGILGVSTSFTAGWALAVTSTWQRHHCSSSYQNLHACPMQHLAELMGHSCTNWLGLMHGIFGSSSIKSVDIHVCIDWALMHKIHPSSVNYLGAHAWSTWVLKHNLIGHSSIYRLGTHVHTNWVLMHVPVGHSCIN